MKITYEFNTNDELFDGQELKRIQKADDLVSCIWDIEQKLRSYWKYDDRGSVPIEEFTEAIYEIIREHNIDTNKLWS